MELKKSIKADLEWRKPMFFQIGVFAALLIVLAMFELFGTSEKEVVEFEYSGQIVTEDVILQTEQPKELPPPPPAPMTTTIIEIIDDNIRIETDFEVDAESDESTVTQEYEYVEYVPEEVVEEEIFVVVEESPEFPGGEESRLKFLTDNIQYPRIARDAGVEGRVIVGFVVEPDGRITNVKIIRGKVQSLDEEALRVTKMMPRWKPGKQRGKPVRVQFTMPITFLLQ
ncbi:MAG: energy transducer TonB [Bacteroidales bacterium]|jgi:protein TonB|nr:energy transducer TonB [Bacteroidales bacterium]MDD3330257.1 energy transducer TonB [Bacteroidales bacterium]MDD3691016.1 energy transducer TonB [Bacteroidales bacterium]MDD4044279.1 energy transducer TonB [Bacteroidales bacterium]MDD4581486.1 energy transducer TonB [Bacteroidales bacterium]